MKVRTKVLVQYACLIAVKDNSLHLSALSPCQALQVLHAGPHSLPQITIIGHFVHKKLEQSSCCLPKMGMRFEVFCSGCFDILHMLPCSRLLPSQHGCLPDCNFARQIEGEKYLQQW